MMNRRFILWLLFQICLTAVCAQKADVTILIDSTSVSIGRADYYTCTHLQKYVLHNSNSASIANIEIGMNPNTELVKFEYVMTDLAGNVIRSVKKSDLQRFEYSQELASDFYRLIAEVTPPSYPVIITRTEKTIRNGNILSYPSFCPQRYYNIAVNHAVYQMTWNADDINVRYKAMNLQTAPTIQQIGKKTSLQYSMYDLHPVKRVYFAPSLDEQVPFVLFAPEEIRYHGTIGSMSSWTSFGKWQYDLTKDRQQLPESHLERIRSMLADCHTEREKIKKIYDYLGQNCRYVAIELGIGGYQPDAANTVMQTGFGDCKGLCNYMHSLLTHLGIKSRLVAIGTDEEDLIPDFANAAQLNHMVLAVLPDNEKDTLWIECTNPKLPIGYIHSKISNHNALLLSPDGGRLVRLPEYADTLNLRHTDVRISLSPNASAEVLVDESFDNHRYAERYYLLNEKEQEMRTGISSWYKLSNTSFGTIRADDASTPFDKARLITHLDGTCAKYANITGRRMFVPINPLRMDFSLVDYDPSEVTMKQPLKIRRGYRDETEVVIEIPEDYSVESLPTSVDIEYDFGAFHQQVLQEKNCLRVSFMIDIRKGIYASDSRQRLIEMLQKVQSTYNGRMVLHKNDI